MKKLLFLLVFIPLVSFGQDKFTALGGYLKVTENNVWILQFQNNDYEYLTDIASVSLNNKSDAVQFVNDYIDCVQNIKTIERNNYIIRSSKKMITVINSDGQFTTSMKKYTKSGIKMMKESLKYID